MRRTELLQEVRKMRFEEAYEGCNTGRLTQEEAARLLGVCSRTFRRYIIRYEEEGMEGLADRRLGQVSHRSAPVDEVMALTDLYSRRYKGFAVKHFYSWYRRAHGGRRSYTWVKNTLQTKGLATKTSGKGTQSSFQAITDVIKDYGVFASLYTDRGAHYWNTPEAGGKVDKDNLTQFGRAIKQLGIEMIPAYSPEARGRSERAFGTHQGRLVKELTVAGITEMKKANEYIRNTYMPAFNDEFTVSPEETASMFVPWAGTPIEDILCEHYERTVGNNNCVRFHGLVLQIPKDQYRYHYVRVWCVSIAIQTEFWLYSTDTENWLHLTLQERRYQLLIKKLLNIKRCKSDSLFALYQDISIC